MAESTVIKPTRKANSGGRKTHLSRRDFLKLAGTGTATVVAVNELSKYTRDNPRSNYIPDFPEPENLGNVESVGQEEAVRSFKKLDAIKGIYYTDMASSWKEYLVKRYSLDSKAMDSLAYENKVDDFRLDQIITFLEACPVSEAPDGDKLEAFFNNPHNGDDLSFLVEYASKHKNIDDWRKIIEEKGLERQICALGPQGETMLLELGFYLSSVEFQKKLISQEDAKRIPNEPAITVNKHKDPKDSVVAIITNTDDNDPSLSRHGEILQFYPEIDMLQAGQAEFTLNRLKNISETCADLPDDFPVDEFIKLQSMIYDHFLLKQSPASEFNEREFFDDSIFNDKSLPGSPLNKVPFVTQFLVDGLVASGVMEMEAKMWVNMAAQGNMGAFKLIIDYGNPGIRSVFNAKTTRTGEKRTITNILENAKKYSPIPDKTAILNSTLDYSTNLFLVSVRQRVMGDADTDIDIFSEKRKSLTDLAAKLLANKITLDAFADEALGYATITVFSEQKGYIGKVLNGVAIEPVLNIPDDLISIINSTEGPLWDTGNKYLQKFVYRNISAKITKEIPSGGSDPAMQLVKILAPSIYDLDIYNNTQINKPDKGSIFHRPDLYGWAYLNQLQLAVRDEKATPFLYEECGSFDAEKLKGSEVGQVCAQLEKFLVARDFRNKFNDKKIMELYVQFVPFGNTSEGLRICGFEAAANYYFDKELSEINRGEMAILVGMLQAPFKYTPNSTEVIERATLVSDLAQTKLGFGKYAMDIQIRAARFSLRTPESWVSDNPDKFAPGSFTNIPINLGFGLAVLKEPSPGFLPYAYVDPDRLNTKDSEQPKLDAWLDSVVDKNQVELATHENSQVANTINSLWGVIYNAQSMRLSGAQIADRVATWCNKNSIDYQNDTYLKYRLLALASTSDANYWQCGQAALLINDVLRLKTGIPEPPFLAVPGAVKNWVATFDGKTVNTQLGYEFRRIDTELNDPFIDMDSIFQPGDMILSWDDADDGSPGHVCTVADKGVDSNGKQYLKLVDNNFGTDNRARSIVLWADDLTSYLTPARKSKTMIIRPEKGFNHGYQSVANDNFFGKQVLTATVENKQVTIPGLIQSVLNKEGDYEPVVNPGMAVAVFDADGFVAGVDRTHVLENTPVIPGGAIKPFVYAFLRLNGLNAADEIQFHPGNYALTDDKTLVTNTSLLIMNLDDRRKITVAEALAGGFDVPYQAIMKELIRENPDAWNQFQSFLNIFGVNLVDYKGEGIASPTALAATGRDVYVRNLDALGFGLSILMNPEKYFDPAEDGNLIDVLKETAEVLMSDKIRAGIDVRGGNTLDLVGEDPFKSNFANATTNVNVGLSRVLWSGTRLGEEDTGFVIVPDWVNHQNKVIVSRFRGGDLTRKKMINLLTLSRDAATLGPAGFPAVTLSVVNSL